MIPIDDGAEKIESKRIEIAEIMYAYKCTQSFRDKRGKEKVIGGGNGGVFEWGATIIIKCSVASTGSSKSASRSRRRT